MMQWIKKISVLGLALFILSGGVGSAAPKKDDLQDSPLPTSWRTYFYGFWFAWG